MPAGGTYTLSDFPEGARIELECNKCARRGRWKREALAAVFGKDASMVSILFKLSADCPKREGGLKFTDRCGASFATPMPVEKTRKHYRDDLA